MAKPGATVTVRGPGLGPTLKRLAELAELAATVGYQGATGAAMAGDAEVSTATLATIHEFGTDHVPSRPFLRRGADKGSRPAGKAAEQALALVLEGKLEPAKGVGRIGEELAKSVAHELATAESWSGAALVDDDRSLVDGLSHAVRRRDQLVGSETT